MFKFLKPREEKFFTLLREMAAQSAESVGYLKTFIDSRDGAQREQAGKAIQATRAASKATSIEITRKLCQTYITPFDREDIQDLASDLYRIPKLVEKAYARISLHNIDQHSGDFGKQIDVMVLEAEAMKEMIHDLTAGKGTADILRQVTILRDLENKGDHVLSGLMAVLYRDITDVRDLMLRKDIYDLLEKIIDRHRDAAGIALQIVLKHS